MDGPLALGSDPRVHSKGVILWHSHLGKDLVLPLRVPWQYATLCTKIEHERSALATDAALDGPLGFLKRQLDCSRGAPWVAIMPSIHPVSYR